jgi:hypothetical protein
MQILEPYDNPFCQNGYGRGREKKIIIAKMVSYLSCSAGRKHFTRSKIVRKMYSPKIGTHEAEIIVKQKDALFVVI